MTPHDYKVLAELLVVAIVFSIIPWSKESRKGWPNFSTERQHRRSNGVGNGLLDRESGMSTLDVLILMVGALWISFAALLLWLAHISPMYKL